MSGATEAGVADRMAPLATIGGYRCRGCGELGARVHRQNTAYVDDICNWTCLCAPCAEENAAYWDERWAEYYSDCL